MEWTAETIAQNLQRHGYVCACTSPSHGHVIGPTSTTAACRLRLHSGNCRADFEFKLKPDGDKNNMEDYLPICRNCVIADEGPTATARFDVARTERALANPVRTRK